MSRVVASQEGSALLQASPAVPIPGFLAKYPAGSEIHGEGEPAEYAYRTLSGVVRTFRILPDGRRQVEGFHFAGDVFSIALGERYKESAEAVSEAQVLVMKRSLIDTLTGSDPVVMRELLNWTRQSLTRAQEQMLLLGRKTALEKVASFLLQLMMTNGWPDVIVLPMSRSDIADYLGLTSETISRVLSQLEREGTIEILGCRQIRIILRDRLQLLAVQI